MSKTARVGLLEHSSGCGLARVRLTVNVHSVGRVRSGVSQQGVVPLTDAHSAFRQTQLEH